MIRSITRFFIRLVQRWLPQPFTLAVGLSILVYVMGIVITGTSAHDMTIYWGKGFFSLYGFTMQMVLLLVTGHALAHARPTKKILRALAKMTQGPLSAICFVSVIATVASYFNWGFGPIIGAVIAREVAVRNAGKGLHFPLLVAASYAGEVMRGPSSSIPLAVASPGHFLEKICGIIPVTQTLYSDYNLIISAVILVGMPILFMLMNPKKGEDEIIELDPKVVAEMMKDAEEEKIEDPTPAQRVDNSVILTALLAIAMGWYLWDFFSKATSFNLSMNIVIMCFFVVGIVAHKTLANYAKAISNAAGTCGGILLQFPFYAGMMGMMRSSGLAAWLSNLFAQFATPSTLPLYTFWSAGLVNIFIPSGGGQWAVQGPIMIEAAQKIGADFGRVTMALCWGDSWTNMIQPFWALPVLAICDLDVRDIMGYCFMIALFVGIVCSLGFLFL
ncbi:MAG: TIGR00366 family protein [Pyramidobacter sp.]|nr:TIGR00366 family protein [Pyramidobacter sp.]